MSGQPNYTRPETLNIDRNQQVRFNANESDSDSTPRGSLPNILPEVDK
jgi:hypothetical protein